MGHVMNRNMGRAGRGAAIAVAAVFAMGLSNPASATQSGTFNDVKIDIHGGNAAAFSGCVNYAKASAKRNKIPQSNACKNFASAAGGSVELAQVSLFVDQEGNGRTTHNNVKIAISGGDATAVAGCVNYLQGTATPAQVDACKNAADAQGGSVKLNNVDIVIIQLGG
ncbi:hypothetical protein JOF56_003911 [Kibdelosporangium banguiense]|uniref:Neocarzinostatin family protein n=1 Tax=Kibdelosporangium banguiense TaxID=1365924 RepID=A0ABS4TGR3_9PSEU|nr:hypothetical protein [Kibdelosporangium banguiense]MBP2323526.1 hypothetical protein [Kibdelosporangium banguiense]